MELLCAHGFQQTPGDWLGESNGSETLISLTRVESNLFLLASSVLTKMPAIWNIVKTIRNVVEVVNLFFFLCDVEELSEQMPKLISTHWLWIWNRGIAPWGTAGFPGPWSRVSELLPLSWCPGPSGHQPADPPLRSDHTLNYTFPCCLCLPHKSGGDALRVVASRYKVSAIVLSGIKSMRDTVIKTHAGPLLFALWQPEGDDCGFWGEQDAI